VIGELAKGAEWDPAADPGGYARAILNILGDLGEDKARLLGTERAILNVLEDAVADKLKLEAAQKATLNILEDFDVEKKKVERINREMAREITERKRAEEVTRGLNAELEAFSYSVSHDLRAPLRAIEGFGRILLDDHAERLDAEGRRVLDVIRKNIGKMGQLIDDLLAFSRLGRDAMTPSRVDMTTLARTVLQDIIAAETDRAIDARVADLPDALGDPTLLRQVWVNLLGNAIKYTRPRSPALIQVTGRTEDDEVVYTVTDNGVGFDMAYVGKLFMVFQRLHKASEFEGTGVGLALVQRIVMRHRGRVWAEARPDEGATFHFALPRKDR
jgi:light-regulated signal transduction histidine kinase (bacteriophytochrome)